MNISGPPLPFSKTVTIIFLHGYCEGQWIWEGIIESLGDQFSCIALDLPGFGNNWQLPEKKSLDAVAESIWRELHHKKISEVILIGHSLGGYVALAMADSKPEFVRGLGLVHSTPFADSEEKKESRNKVIAFVEQYGSSLFLDQFAPGLFYDKSSSQAIEFRKKIDGTSAASIIYYAAAMRDRPDRSCLIRESKFFTLVICGRFDQILSPELCNQSKIAGSHVYTHLLNHSSHVGMLEEPVKTAEIIQKFLKKCQS